MTPRPVLAGILLFALVIPGSLLALLAHESQVVGAVAITAALVLAAVIRPS